jgi:DNA-binding Xre family transcriptional regulator
MILCNLQNLLAEKRTNISKVSRDTGISRTTLTSLYSNISQGVQLETVNTLCKYFDIGIEKFFLFSKYDIYVKSNMPYFEIEKFPTSVSGSVSFSISYYGVMKKCNLSCVQYFHYDKNYIKLIESELEFYDEDQSTDIEEENRILKKVFSELQPMFKQQLKNEIEDTIHSNYDVYFIDGYERNVEFPEELI